MKLITATVIVLALLLFSSPSQSADNQGAYALSLEEASQLALKNNFDIQLLKYDAWIARTKRGKIESMYDTILSGDVQYHKDQSRKTSTIFGTKSVDNDYNVALSKKIPTGTKVEVGMDNNRNASNSSFVSSAVTHDSSLGASLTQPLGKNIFGFEDRGEVKITEHEIQMSEYTSLGRIEENIALVQKSYWDLVLYSQMLVVENEMVNQARKLLDTQQDKFNDGLIEKAELLASDTNYKIRLNDQKIAENFIKTKANVLRLMLNIQDDNVDIVVSDSMAINAPIKDVSEALKTSLEEQWDFKALQADAKAKNVRLSVKKNSLWPQIDLKASFKRNGLGDHFNQAIRNISEEDNPDFLAALMVSFPLENHLASAELKAAQLSKAQSLVALKLLERKIVLGIYDQWRDCKVNQEVAESQEEIAVLQAQKLDEELKRYQYGRSSTDQVIRFQEDVLIAKRRAIEAKHQLVVSLIELDRRQGTLLGRYLTKDFLKE